MGGKGSGEGAFGRGAAYVAGRILPVGEASIPLLDWGFLRSDVTYDTVHVWKGRFFRLDDHLDRFERSMAALSLSAPLTRAEIKEVLIGCLRRSGLRDAYVQMLCTRGTPPPGSRDPRLARNAFYAFAIPFVWIANEEVQARGLDLHVSSVQRIPPEAVDPRVKNFHWADMTRGLMQALEAGGESVVLVDRAGNVIEGPGFNLFAISAGRLVTPDSGMLEGITRMTVLELAQGLGLEPEIRPLPVAELRSAEEVFLTSTAGGVMPVGRLDGRQLGGGGPGPQSLRIRQAYWDLHEDPRHSLAVDYDAVLAGA